MCQATNALFYFKEYYIQNIQYFNLMKPYENPEGRKMTGIIRKRRILENSKLLKYDIKSTKRNPN